MNKVVFNNPFFFNNTKKNIKIIFLIKKSDKRLEEKFFLKKVVTF